MTPRSCVVDNKTTVRADLKTAVAERITAKKPFVLGMLARELGVTELAVGEALPETMRAFAPKESFDRVWQELTTWEKATFIMRHAGSVLEVKGTIPPGTHGNGFFNLRGESGIGGHLKVDDLAKIGFFSMPFMGLESHSVQFFDEGGADKFSIYAGRNGRTLIPAVVESFSRLREAVCKESR